MRMRTCGTALLALTIGAAAAGAQTENEFGAYGALIGTPIGALTPLMTSTMTGVLQRGAQFAVRYGYLKRTVQEIAPTIFDSFDMNANNAAASVILPMGVGTTVSLTAGGFFPGCDGCSSHLMLSVGGDTRIGAHAMSDAPNSSLLMLAVNGELGYGHPQDVNMLAGAVGLPISLVQRGQGMRIVPFVIPQIAFGSQYVDTGAGTETFSGMRFAVGGGVGIFNPASTVSVTGGFQYVHLPKSMAVFGLTLQLGGM